MILLFATLTLFVFVGLPIIVIQKKLAEQFTHANSTLQIVKWINFFFKFVMFLLITAFLRRWYNGEYPILNHNGIVQYSYRDHAVMISMLIASLITSLHAKKIRIINFIAKKMYY